MLPAGWAWTISFFNVPGNPASFSFFLPFSGGANQNLSSLTPLSSTPVLNAYTPPGRPATLIVAASNASAAWRNAADYVCTGTADDVQVRAAIAALPTWGGKILLSDGQFSFAAAVELSLSDVLIEGTGIQSTTVAVTPGANCNAFQYTGTAAIIFCSLRNMLINGNKTGNTTGYGIYIQPSGSGTFWDFHVRDVFAVNIAQDGFFAYDGHGYVLDHFLAEICGGSPVNFAHPGPSGAAPPEVRNGTFKNCGPLIMGVQGGVVAECEFQIITGDGIQLTGAGSKATDNWIGSCTGNGITMSAFGAVAEGNMIVSNTGNGIVMQTGPGAAIGNYVELNGGYGIVATTTGCLVEGNMVGGNTLAGVEITSSQGIAVSGNYIYQNGQQGVLCSAAVALIDGNSLSNNSQTTVNTYDEIQVTNNGATVTANVINGNSRSRYGINFSGAGTTGQVATGNNISGMATAASNSATASVTWLANTGVAHSLPSALAMGSSKITGLANGSAASDAAAFGQIPVIDSTAADIQPDGVQAAGNSTKAAAANHVHQNNADLSLYLAPASATAETVPRGLCQNYSGPLVSGTVYISAIPLPAGLVVNNIGFMFGSTAFATTSHGWYALLDAGMVVRAVTADQTTAFNTSFNNLKLGTNAYTTPAAGLYYMAFCAVSGTMGTISSNGIGTSVPNQAPPILSGTSTTGATTPPGTGTTLAAAVAATLDRLYAYTA